MRVGKILGIHDDQWRQLDPLALAPAFFLLGGTALLLAFNRFGGLLIDDFRAFVRMALITVFGWLGVSIASSLIAAGMNTEGANTEGANTENQASLAHFRSLTLMGYAHGPIMLLGFFMFLLVGLLQINGPGVIVAIFVGSFWLPTTFTMAIRHAHRISVQRALMAIVVPYIVWASLVGRYLVDQLKHLL